MRSKYVLLVHPETRTVVRRTTSDRVLKASELYLILIHLDKSLWKQYRAGDSVHINDWPEYLR